MTKFHINSNTNKPEHCEASPGACSLGSALPHFSTEEDAKQALNILQGSNFGINYPLLTANKNVIKKVLDYVKEAYWHDDQYPEDKKLQKSTLAKLEVIAEIGFASNATREEASKQMREVAQKLFAQRTSSNFATAFTARRLYDYILLHLKDHKLEDLRSEDSKAIDELLSAYNLSENHENYGLYSEEELERIKCVAENVRLEDFTEDDTALTNQASFTSQSYYFRGFETDDVARAKQAKQIRKVIFDYEELPAHVKSVLGSKDQLASRADELDKSTEKSISRKEQMSDYVANELERRVTNAAIEKALAKETSPK